MESREQFQKWSKWEFLLVTRNGCLRSYIILLDILSLLDYIIFLPDTGEANWLEWLYFSLIVVILNPVGFVYSLEVLTQALEMRENFQRQLQEIMSATSIVKPQGQRGSLSRNSFDSSPATPDSARSVRNGRSRALEALRYRFSFQCILSCPLYSDSHWNMNRSPGFSVVLSFCSDILNFLVIQNL